MHGLTHFLYITGVSVIMTKITANTTTPTTISMSVSKWLGLAVDVGVTCAVFADTDDVNVVVVTFTVDVGETVCPDADDVQIVVVMSEQDFDGS